MDEGNDADTEKAYPLPEFIAKFRRLAILWRRGNVSRSKSRAKEYRFRCAPLTPSNMNERRAKKRSSSRSSGRRNSSCFACVSAGRSHLFPR